MGHAIYDPGQEDRPAWNVGRKLGTKRPLLPKQVWAVRFFLEQEHRVRDRALFDLSIDSKLRGCDLVKIKIDELVSGARIRQRRFAGPALLTAERRSSAARNYLEKHDERLGSRHHVLRRSHPAGCCSAKKWSDCGLAALQLERMDGGNETRDH